MEFDGDLVDMSLAKGGSIRLFDAHNNVDATVINSETFLNKNGQRIVRFSAKVDIVAGFFIVTHHILLDLMDIDNIRSGNVMLETYAHRAFRLLDGRLHLQSEPLSPEVVISGNIIRIGCEDITKEISEEKEGELSRWEMMDLD